MSAEGTQHNCAMEAGTLLNNTPQSLRVRMQGPALESNGELNRTDGTETPETRTGARILQTGWQMLRSERAPHIRGTARPRRLVKRLMAKDGARQNKHHLFSEGFPTRCQASTLWRKAACLDEQSFTDPVRCNGLPASEVRAP